MADNMTGNLANNAAEENKQAEKSICSKNPNAAYATAERAASVKLAEHPTQPELEEFFKHDTFAYNQAGCRIVEGWRGHGVCEMQLEPHKHCNAQQHVMGGAIFTLADYAFAVASMCGEVSSVSLTSTIEFMKSTKGTKLIATCDVDHASRKMGFYTTVVRDDLGEMVAKVSTTGYRPVVAEKA